MGRAIDLARQALETAPDAVDVLEFLALALVTRRRAYGDGLAYIDRAVVAAPDDPGVWYTRGWCYEFAAHELRRRPRMDDLEPRALYTSARESFVQCLSLHPDGKLAGDAEDLLDHVENELVSL